MQALFIAIPLMVGFFAMSLVHRGSVAERNVAQLKTQAARTGLTSNGFSLVRGEFLDTIRQQKISGAVLVNALRCAAEVVNCTTGLCATPDCPAVGATTWPASCQPNLPAGSEIPPCWAKSLVQSHTVTGAPVGMTLTSKITGVSPSTSEVNWVAVNLTATTPNPKDPNNPILTVRNATVNMGQSSVFQNAITGNSFSCVFCHANVWGNVAQYDNNTLGSNVMTTVHGTWFSGGAFSPEIGWQGQPNSFDSFGLLTNPTSSLNGRMNAYDLTLPATAYDYVGPTFSGSVDPTSDVDDPSTSYYYYTWGAASNNTTHVRDHQEYYQGPALPWNPQRQEHMLPKFDPNSALILATGSVSEGEIFTVPYGSSTAPTQVIPPNITGISNTNVILNGRDGQPLLINGAVFFRGDVIIFGKIQGQGTIYAGRNIYVADDITYVNPPKIGSDIFGTLPTMLKLSFVGNPCTGPNSSPNCAALIAQQTSMVQGDRLALMATNNIIVGNPYPDNNPSNPTNPSTTPTSPFPMLRGTSVPNIAPATNDIRFIQIAQLSAYDGSLAQDSRSGYMLDGVLLPDNSTCFIAPWGKPTDCIPSTSSEVVLTPHFYYPPTSPVNISPPSAAGGAYMDDQYVAVKPSWTDNFLPKNMSSGTLSDWIAPATFFTMTTNGSKINAAQALTHDIDVCGPSHNQACGRHDRYKWHGLTIDSRSSSGTDPFNSQALSASDIWGSLDNSSGAVTALAGKPVNGNTSAPNDAQTLFKNFLALCVDVAQGNNPNDPTNVVNPGLNNATYNNIQTYTGGSMSNVGVPQGVTASQVVCDFTYDIGQNSSGQGRAVGNIYVEGMDGGFAIAYACYDSLSTSASRRTLCSVDNPGAGQNSCAYQCLFPTSPIAPQSDPHGGPPGTNGSVYFDDDFHVHISIGRIDGWRMGVMTRLWDQTKEMPDNGVNHVQAMLFANHFVAFPSSFTDERSIQIDGGIISKDIFGRFVDSIGPTNPAGLPITSAGVVTPYGAGHGTQGSTASLKVVLDPRFQFELDLIYEDFATPTNIQ